ncbi:hypothetical protein GCM10009802_24620 [Streptomyces synnematoformans]|uniref:Peptidoglycan binding-like domain-containing protein n=2 Tax=Streptomyces synnematoformans TaxID=415721 RepID=A0ABN2Y402_9ACTN
MAFPPREAVAAAARVGGEDPTRLLVLYEIAAERWEQRGEVVVTGVPRDPPEAAAHPPAERQPYGRGMRAVVVAGAGVLVLSVSAVLVLAVQLAETRAALARERADSAAAGGPARVSESLVPVVYSCRLKQRDGRWYAGLSRTTDTLLAYTHTGPEVAEAQCLLRRAGSRPGAVDGVFGPRTQRAVQRVQTRHGLVVDGVIGPHTWKALREVAPE